MRLPPGAAGGMLAVPSAGDQLSGEVEFLFADLDEIQRRRETLIAAARADAAEAERTALEERGRVLAQAHEEAERRAARLLAQRRALAEERGQALLAGATREAARIRNCGRDRTPMLVQDIVTRFLEDAR